MSQRINELAKEAFCIEAMKSRGYRLVTTGQYRAKTYHIPGHMLPTAEDVFENTTNNNVDTTNLGSSTTNSGLGTTNSEPSTTNSEPSTTNLDEKGRIVHPQIEDPLIDDISILHPDYRKELEKVAELPRTKKRTDPDEMIKVILEL